MGTVDIELAKEYSDRSSREFKERTDHEQLVGRITVALVIVFMLAVVGLRHAW